jgi:hypothetical protein
MNCSKFSTGSFLSGITEIKNTATTVFFGVLFYICAKGQMKPLDILLRTIIERERTENEKGIEGRRGIFEKKFRKTGIWFELK